MEAEERTAACKTVCFHSKACDRQTDNDWRFVKLLAARIWNPMRKFEHKKPGIIASDEWEMWKVKECECSDTNSDRQTDRQRLRLVDVTKKPPVSLRRITKLVLHSRCYKREYGYPYQMPRPGGDVSSNNTRLPNYMCSILFFCSCKLFYIKYKTRNFHHVYLSTLRYSSS